MLITIFLNTIVYVLGLILSPLPDATTLPFGVDALISTGMGDYNSIAVLFPPFALFMQITLVYLAYKVTMIMLKVFLGSRSPTLE